MSKMSNHAIEMERIWGPSPETTPPGWVEATKGNWIKEPTDCELELFGLVRKLGDELKALRIDLQASKETSKREINRVGKIYSNLDQKVENYKDSVTTERRNLQGLLDDTLMEFKDNVITECQPQLIDMAPKAVSLVAADIENFFAQQRRLQEETKEEILSSLEGVRYARGN